MLVKKFKSTSLPYLSVDNDSPCLFVITILVYVHVADTLSMPQYRDGPCCLLKLIEVPIL